MQKIKTLDQLTYEVYARSGFRSLAVDQQLVIVKIQKNNIAIARLELKANKKNSSTDIC